MANKVVVLEAEVEEVTGMATKGLVEVGEDTPGEAGGRDEDDFCGGGGEILPIQLLLYSMIRFRL